MIHRSPSARDWAMLLALSGLWGGSFFFNQLAFASMPPLVVIAGRVSVAALALMLTMRLMGMAMPRDSKALTSLFVMGLLNNAIPFLLIIQGQYRIGSGLAAILNASTPLFAALIAHMATPDEKMTPAKTLGVALGFFGVAVMMGVAPQASQGRDWLAPAMVLAGALSYACAGVYGRRFRAMGVAPLATATGQLLGSSLVLVPLAMLVDQPWRLPSPSLSSAAALLGLALLSTALAYILYFRILASAGAVNLLLVTFLIPASAILLGALFLGERLAGRHYFGLALLGAGLAAIDGRAWRRLSALRR